jgi:hypothetical protein
MRLIKEKTYKRYMVRIDRLMSMPKLSLKHRKELIRLATSAERYEKVKWPLNHTRRRVSGKVTR